MATKNKFASVGADLRPGHLDEVARRRSKSARGVRSRMAARDRGKAVPDERARRKILALTVLGMTLTVFYVVTLVTQIFTTRDYTIFDALTAGALLFSLVFLIVQGFGYSNLVIKALWGYRSARAPLFASSESPAVACLITAFNEPPELLEETVAAVVALNYPNKDVVILDDSTKEANREASRAIAEKYGVKCVQRTNRRGYKAGAINDYLPEMEAPYLAVFDADALPTTNFLRECMPQIHSNPKLAFLQTPQYYANEQISHVALAATRQQNVFFEFICEGKSYSRAAFCCGTNVILRRAALEEIGGFDEENVTEDFATSFYLHCRGWDSLFLNKVYAYSMAPENLTAYFMQQSRWSFGTMGTARSFIRVFLKNPRALRFGQWWEYMLSATYYWIGFINIIYMLLPILYFFFNIKPLRNDMFTYMVIFVPYMFFTLNMFYSGMKYLGYKANEIALGQQIGFLSFPIYIASGISVLLNQKRPFSVTPKGVGGRIPWKSLWPQLLMLTLSFSGAAIGIYRLVMGSEYDNTAVVINTLWALYNGWMLSGIFLLNRPMRDGTEKRFFDDMTKERHPLPQPMLDGLKNPVTLRRVWRVGMSLSVIFMAFVVWKITAWNLAPVHPVNVSIVDRTLGEDSRQHRALTWTLNHLKVAKQPTFGPSGGERTNYDLNLDYYGFVPDPQAAPRQEVAGSVPVIYGSDRPLPRELKTPGAIYLADVFGEYLEVDLETKRSIRYRNRRRGLTAPEIDAIEAFARSGGLVMAEWNSLGFPTRPGSVISPAQLEAAIESQRVRITRLNRQTFPAAFAALRVAQNSGDFRRISVARGRVEDARGAVVDAEAKLRVLQDMRVFNTLSARQAEAAARLERLLRVSYTGWYGHYVQNFADEKNYNYALWKRVRDELTRRNGGKATEPSGRGFVFYADAPSPVFDAATGVFKTLPVPAPVAILSDELGEPLNGDGELALIEPSKDAKIADDPLLRGVAAQTPARNWFDILTVQEGGRVLANYRLSVAPSAARRLQEAGFPARYIAPDGKSLIFPAAVAGRDGDTSRGELRSLYMVGDASGYSTVSSIATNFPALGGVEAVLSRRFGGAPEHYYWGFYQPIMRNVFETTVRLRYEETAEKGGQGSER